MKVVTLSLLSELLVTKLCAAAAVGCKGHTWAERTPRTARTCCKAVASCLAHLQSCQRVLSHRELKAPREIQVIGERRGQRAMKVSLGKWDSQGHLEKR